MKRIQVAIISIFLLLTYTSPTFAACPEESSKDNERLNNYAAVIHSYIQSVRDSLNTTDAGKEFIAGVPAYNVGDYIMGPSLDYYQYLNEVAAADEALNQVEQQIANGTLTPSGSLVSGTSYAGPLYWEHVILPRVFYWQKASESPYPLVKGANGNYARDGKAKNDAGIYLAALKTRNNKKVEALGKYLGRVDNYFKQALTWSDTTKPAPKELFDLAKSGVYYAYQLTTVIRSRDVTKAQKNYERLTQLYAAVEKYSNSCMQAIQSVHQIGETYGWWAGFPTTGYLWGEIKWTSCIRLDWDKYFYTATQKEYALSPPSTTWSVWMPTTTFSNEGFLPGDIAKYDVAQVKTSCAAQITELSPDNETLLVNKIAGKYEHENNFYNPIITARNTLLSEVNTIIQNFKTYFPTANRLVTLTDIASGTDIQSGFSEMVWWFSSPGISMPLYHSAIDFKAEGFVSDAKPSRLMYELPFNLDSKVSGTVDGYNTYDPYTPGFLGGEITYRWIMTGIPETQEAKSLKYVMHQTISTGKTCTFSPDLAGAWNITLEVSDGINTVWTLPVYVNAIRRILWVKHSDADTTLETDPTGKFYLEVAHEQTALYKNFDDNGKPVDLGDYYCADKCFTIKASDTIEFYGGTGRYDGSHGSSPAEVTSSYATTNFQLKSSSAWPDDIVMGVTVFDSGITDLVLPCAGCLYGNKVSRQQSSSTIGGSYNIKQWIDNYYWWNSGGGFVQNPGRLANCPDWLERKAVDAITSLPATLAYVKYISANKDMPSLGMVERTHPGEDLYNYIQINPYPYPNNILLRWNLPGDDIYGFHNEGWCNAVARHEAYHLFYSNTVWPKKYPDNDTPWRDYLPGDTAAGMFEYTFDSAANIYGGWGAWNTSVEDAYQYSGDLYPDDRSIKKYASKVVFDKTNIYPRSIELILRPNIPIVSADISIYVKVIKNLKPQWWPVNEKTHYFYIFKDKFTPQPKLAISLSNIALWQQNIKDIETRGGLVTNEMKILCVFKLPFEPEEFDASRLEPGTYTGLWGGSR